MDDMRARASSIVPRMVGALGVALSVATALPAVAQDASSRAIARELFRDGLSAVEAGDLERAEDRFRRALAIQESAVLRYNLASTLAKRERLIEAEDQLARILNDPDAADDVRRSATALREEIAGRFGRLTLLVEGERTDLEVRIGDRVVPLEAIGTPIPVDPGVFEVRASVHGDVVDTDRVLVNHGEHLHVTLTVPASATPPTSMPSELRSPGSSVPAPRHDAASHASVPPPRDESGSVLTSPWLWVGVGVLVTGGVVAALALSADASEEPAMGTLGVVTLRR